MKTTIQNSQELKSYRSTLIHRTPIALKKINMLQFILLLLISNTCLGGFGYSPIEDDIEKSNLIIKGKLINKYYERRESQYIKADKNGEIIHGVYRPIFTIFVFSVDEVLKGVYLEKEIEVMMKGGCENNECVSRSVNYSYDIGEEGVMFLKTRLSDPTTYHSRIASKTAFTLTKDGKLLKKSDNDSDYSSISINKDGKYVLDQNEVINIDQLKNIIESGKITYF